MLKRTPLRGAEVVMASFLEKGVPLSAADLGNAPIRCANPIRDHRSPVEFYFPCGKCELCRAYDGQVLAHRIDLEAQYHRHISHVTLTYAPAKRPAGNCLSLDDVTRFLKRLRFHHGRPLRYYYVAEYGSGTLLPHYHFVLYGWAPCEAGGTRFLSDGQTPNCCRGCMQLSHAWGMGRCEVRALIEGHSFYLSGYVTKHHTGAGGPALLVPEFARWSRQPGLAYAAVDDIAAALLSVNPEPDDAPVALRYGPYVRPLGEYLRNKLREVLDITPEQVLASRKAAADHQVAANRAARSHGTTAPAMGAALLAERQSRRRPRHQ